MHNSNKEPHISNLIIIILYLLVHELWARFISGPYSFAILEFLFLMIAYVYLKQREQPITLGNLFAIRKFSKGSTMTFLGLVLLCIISRILVHYFLFPKEVCEPIMATAHSSVTINLGDFIYQCVIPPMAEELLFRGLFLSILLKELKHNLVLAIFLSAMIFAGLHPNYIQAYIAGLAGGLIYGWAFVQTRSVFSSMILHALWNVFIFVPFL